MQPFAPISQRMTTVTGHIADIVAAFGRSKADPLVAAITAGDDEQPSSRRFSNPAAEYLTFKHAGVKLLFENGGKLEAVFVISERDQKHEPKFAAYADPTRLIDGLNLHTATRGDVRRVLGAPYREDGYALYRIQENRVVHVEFSASRDDYEDAPEDPVRKVTIMARDVNDRA